MAVIFLAVVVGAFLLLVSTTNNSSQNSSSQNSPDGKTIGAREKDGSLRGGLERKTGIVPKENVVLAERNGNPQTEIAPREDVVPAETIGKPQTETAPKKVVVPIDSWARRFQILGACSLARCYCPDVVRVGTILEVKAIGDDVWAVRSGDRLLGIFPPRIRREWMAMAEAERYQTVVVVQDVDLNDKYGRCFVAPYGKGCADSS